MNTQSCMTNRATSRDRGIVLMLTLLAVILLVGMVLFTINLGRQTTRRIDVQNAADSTAIAGAGWVARSLNTVAMNNIGITRLLSLVNVVDAMPLAVQFTKEEHEQTLASLRALLQRGVSVAWVRDRITYEIQLLEAELAILNPMHSFFESNDVTQLTFFDSNSGRGQYWRAMEAMSELSVATMEGLGEFAQLNAVRGGMVNLDRISTDAITFMAPLKPTIPYIIGEFDDFQRPVLNGLLPDKIDDKEFNRGPWDTLLGWRNLNRDNGTTIGGSTGGTPSTSSGGPGGGWGGAPSSGGQYIPGPVTSYSVYPYTHWMLEQISNMTSRRLPQSRLSYWTRRLAYIKQGYLWPGTGPQVVSHSRLITDFNEAVRIAETTPGQIEQTWFVRTALRSSVSMTSGGFLNGAAFRYEDNSPRVNRLGGWHDPRQFPNPQGTIDPWSQIDDWTWRIQVDISQTDSLMPFGVEVQSFVGILVLEEYEIRNPHNFTSKQNLPRPIDLDHGQLGHDNEVGKQDFLNYLAIAELNDRAVAWPSRFDGRKPYPYQVAIAQAHVFNDHSWDLWTQMWEAQLRPVENIDAWVDRMESGDASALPSDVTAQKVSELAKYLRSVRDIIDRMTRD